ncbi:(3S,6E)-nerolidol synthase 1-like [Aristolochia californica]|uniref:(3S,6E)-nerolidol synthase 1-like n=1 Tax=Aristolochia californica TaxID=171875 RepID=UPI0035DCC574
MVLVFSAYRPTLPGGSAALHTAQNITSRGVQVSLLTKTSVPYEKDDLRVKQAEKVKQVRDTILESADHYSSEHAKIIDTLQRLGIDHHFHEEIGLRLGLCYEHIMSGDSARDSLYDVAIAFRLLRQHGYYVSPNVFDRFRDGKGRFKLQLSDDVMGLLALYDASYLAIEEEDALVEAADFASKHIVARLPTMGSGLAKRAKYALDNPIHMTLPRYSTKFYLENSKLGATGKTEALHELAKLSFNSAQFMHLEELRSVRQWWSDLGVAKELKFARNQPLKWFMWSLALVPDARFSKYRIELTKPISFLYVIDDIFDTYGSLEELILFAEAVNRWSIDGFDSLPGYMKICFSALYNTTNEIADKILKEHGWNPIDTLRKSWAALCDAFLVEAKWFSMGHLPPADEYLRNGFISTGMPMVLLHLLSLLGEGASFDCRNLHCGMPALISSPATILRLWDDLGSAKDEKQQGYDGSYLNCYLNENGNSLQVEKAREHVVHLITGEWKKLNKACLSPNSFSPAFTSGSLNSTRMVQVMYSYNEDHLLESLEQHTDYLLREPSGSIDFTHRSYTRELDG